MTRCLHCGTYGADVCSPQCEQALVVADCEASGHVVQGDYCYCGMASAPAQ